MHKTRSLSNGFISPRYIRSRAALPTDVVNNTRSKVAAQHDRPTSHKLGLETRPLAKKGGTGVQCSPYGCDSIRGTAHTHVPQRYLLCSPEKLGREWTAAPRLPEEAFAVVDGAQDVEGLPPSQIRQHTSTAGHNTHQTEHIQRNTTRAGSNSIARVPQQHFSHRSNGATNTQHTAKNYDDKNEFT